MGQSLAQAWTVFRERLEVRSRALRDEVRSYPTPIARCDDQLPKAIELRGEAARAMQVADELDRGGADLAGGEWLARVGELAAAVDTGEDRELASARAALLDALARR